LLAWLVIWVYREGAQKVNLIKLNKSQKKFNSNLFKQKGPIGDIGLPGFDGIDGLKGEEGDFGNVGRPGARGLKGKITNKNKNNLLLLIFFFNKCIR